MFQKKEFMDCLDPSVIKKRKLTQSDYKVRIGNTILVTKCRRVIDEIECCSLQYRFVTNIIISPSQMLPTSI